MKAEKKKFKKGDYDTFFEGMEDFFQSIKTNEAEFESIEEASIADLEFRLMKLKQLMHKMNREERQGRLQNQKAIQIKLEDDLVSFLEDIEAIAI